MGARFNLRSWPKTCALPAEIIQSVRSVFTDSLYRILVLTGSLDESIDIDLILVVFQLRVYYCET